MLAETCATPPVFGSTTERPISASSRSAVVRTASGLSACASSATNSSPPSRHTTSDSRSVALMRRLTASSSSSPAAWPSVSLTCLKRSRSMNSTATWDCVRRAAEICWCTSSRNSERFGSPVRSSNIARMCSSAFLLSSSPNSVSRRSRTSLRWLPSWPSSSRWRQTSAGVGSRETSALACAFRRSIGRSSRADSTTISTTKAQAHARDRLALVQDRHFADDDRHGGVAAARLDHHRRGRRLQVEHLDGAHRRLAGDLPRRRVQARLAQRPRRLGQDRRAEHLHRGAVALDERLVGGAREVVIDREHEQRRQQHAEHDRAHDGGADRQRRPAQLHRHSHGASAASTRASQAAGTARLQ